MLGNAMYDKQEQTFVGQPFRIQNGNKQSTNDSGASFGHLHVTQRDYSDELCKYLLVLSTR